MSTSDVQRSDLLGSVTGYAAQPWIAEPTRAGWWVWWDFAQAAPELYRIKIEDTPLTKGAFYWSDRRQQWESCGFKNWREMGVRGGWAGPVERPEPSNEETPHIENKISHAYRERAWHGEDGL